jgi:hypothetical protein
MSSTTEIVRQGEFVNAKKKEKISEPFMFTADQTGTVLLDPGATKRLVVQAILITGAGNSGTIKVHRESRPLDKCILPCYFTNSNRNNTSSELNLAMNKGEKLLVTTTGRGTNESFIGIGYNLEEE